MKRFVVGITGKYASGKSIVAGEISRHGVRVIDVDRIGHKIINNYKKQIIDAFGDSIIDSDGNIDRKLLGDIVFKSRSKLILLENILHPAMRNAVQSIISNTEDNICIDSAIIYRMRLAPLCDIIIYVKAGPIITIRNIIKRGGITGIIKAFKILRYQRDVYYRKGNILIKNSISLKRFKIRINKAISMLEEYYANV